jgi:hypothetical protein
MESVKSAAQIAKCRRIMERILIAGCGMQGARMAGEEISFIWDEDRTDLWLQVSCKSRNRWRLADFMHQSNQQTIGI